MVYTGFTKPTNRIVGAGKPLTQELKVETATNMYPGRLVQKGTNDDDVIVGTAFKGAGWLGFEQSNPAYRPSTVDTIYEADTLASILSGAGFTVVGSLAVPSNVSKGDSVANWADGQVVGPAYPANGGVLVVLPFTKSTTVVDTGLDLPADVLVKDAWVDVSTAVASGTIDVGFENAVESGDLDGLIDGLSCAAEGKIRPSPTVTAGGSETYLASNTRGALLSNFLAGSDAATDVGTYTEIPYKTDGTIESIVYTTSNHEIAGNIYLELIAPGLRIVGDVEESVDASSAAADILIRSAI